MPVTGLCGCGCGQATPICKYTLRTQGYIKGQPLRFIPGHQSIGRKQRPETIARRVAKLLGHAVSEKTRRKLSEHHRAAGIRPSKEACALGARGKFREASGSWKGGVSMTNGYRCVYRPDHPRRHPNGYVYEHIVVAEEALGRPLLPGEVVHHIDRNKTNNAPENLHVFASQSDHIAHHRAEGDVA